MFTAVLFVMPKRMPFRKNEMPTYNKMDRLCYIFTQQNTMSNENESITTIHSNMDEFHKHNANQKNAYT